MLNLFSHVARSASIWLGHPVAFCLAVLGIIGWALSGRVFAYSDSWQLVVNTGTTILTFLMIFLVQNTQNRDARAMHLKLDELLRSSKARNALINVEHFSEEELETYCKEFAAIHQRYAKELDERRAKQASLAK